MSKFLDYNGLSYFNGKLNEKLVQVEDEVDLTTTDAPWTPEGSSFIVTVDYYNDILPVAYYRTSSSLSSDDAVLQWAGIPQSYMASVTIGLDPDDTGYYLETISCTDGGLNGFRMEVTRRSLYPNNPTEFELYGYSYSTTGTPPSNAQPNVLTGSGYLYQPFPGLDYGETSDNTSPWIICGFTVTGGNVYVPSVTTPSIDHTQIYDKPCTEDPEISGGLLSPPFAVFPGDLTLYREVIEEGD